MQRRRTTPTARWQAWSPLVAVALVAVALAAPHGAGHPAPTDGLDAVEPVVATELVATDGGPVQTSLAPPENRYPTGSEDQRAVVRDCGFSAPLPTGQSVWVFCDTVVYDGIHGPAPDHDASVRVIPSGTAGLVAPQRDPSPLTPVEVQEAGFPDLPARFVTSSGAHGPADDRRPIACAPGIVPFAWTKGVVTLPGTSTVLAFFQDHCPDLASGYPEYDVGVAELDVATSGPDDLSGADQLRADRRYDSVLVNPTPGSSRKWGYASGPVVHGEHLYLFNATPPLLSCDGITCRLVEAGAVRVARVPWADGAYRDGSRYRYYTGDALDPWSADPDDAVDVLPDDLLPSGDGLSVAWYPQLGQYVMTHAASRIVPTSGVAVRTAVTPWGPWSAPVDLRIDAGSSFANPGGGCDAPTPCRTFVLHPELTPYGGQTLHLSYVRKQDHAAVEGDIATFAGRRQFRVRMAGIPLTALPPAAPETTLLSGPAAATSATEATFRFAGEGRPASGADPAAPSAATGFACSLDGAPATPCSSPVTVSGLGAGAHTFQVTALDASGLADPSPATVTWSVDLAPPDTAVATGPTSPAMPSASTFSFTGTDDQTSVDALTYECALDEAPWTSCTATWTATASSTGTRTLSVRAVDRAGNVDPTPATWTWYVDMPPTVTVTSGPAAFTRWTSANVWFAVADDLTPRWGLVPTCSVDGSPFAPCAAPVVLADLLPGDHEVVVRVVDGSGFVGEGVHRWTVDLAPPAAPAVEGPPPIDDRPTATFAVTATDDHSAPADLAFECSLDWAPFAACLPPVTFDGLAPGNHRFAVRAVDQAGNTSPATVATWAIDLSPPTATITSAPADGTTDIVATFGLAGTDDRTLPGAITFACSLDGAPPAPCSSGVTYPELLPGTAHAFEVVAVDEAGNRSPAVRHDWTIPFAATSPPPPPATTGVAYEHTFTANTPELAPWTTWRVTAGTLPYGMRVWGGVLSGTPIQGGTFGPITVTGTSTLGTVDQTFQLTVAETDSMVGTVRNAATGAPVAGVRVRAYNDLDALAKVVDAGPDGTYRLGYVPPGSYRLQISDPAGEHVTGYSGGAPSLAAATPVAVADGTAVVADASLVPLSTIGGTVRSEVGGEALAGMWVSLFDASGASLGLRKTDATGWFAFRYLAAGTYRVKVSDPAGRHAPEFWQDQATLPTATPVTVGSGGLTRTDVEVTPLTSITGTAVDEVTGLPVAGVWVSLVDPTGRLVTFRVTDAAGRYAFLQQRPGTYHLLFAHPAGTHGREWWSDAATQAASTPVVASGGTAVADVALTPNAVLSGRITSSVTGLGLAGIRVGIIRPDGTGAAFATTGADGHYELTRIPPGSYRISFGDATGAHRLEYWQESRDLAGATPVPLGPGTTTVVDNALDPVTVLEVRVVSDVDGRPVAGARVSLFDATGRGIGLAFADADGVARYANLAPGTYHVGLGDPSGAHRPEHWQDAADLASSTPVVATGGTITITASLAPTAPAPAPAPA